MNRLQKHLGALVFCTFYRLMRIVPNNDPIMAFALPFARKDRWWQAALFPFLAMALLDIFMNRLGTWTLVTATTYALIGLGFSQYFKSKKKVGLKTYGLSAVAGILFFDAITGPLMSSFMFRIPLEAATIGQIPFTLLHLATGVSLTLLIAPMLDPDLRKYSLVHRISVKMPWPAKGTEKNER